MRDRPRREHPDARPEVARAPVAHPPDVAAVLRLQALAGNAATSRLLAREPAPAAAQERSILLEGMGSFPLVSFQLAGDKGVRVMLEDGPVGPHLARACSDGTPIPSVAITSSGHTLTFRDVTVMSFQLGGEPGPVMITAELQGASRELR